MLIDELYESLCNSLQIEFNPIKFHCKDFITFLNDYMGL